jgi:hypothetical protein
MRSPVKILARTQSYLMVQHLAMYTNMVDMSRAGSSESVPHVFCAQPEVSRRAQFAQGWLSHAWTHRVENFAPEVHRARPILPEYKTYVSVKNHVTLQLQRCGAQTNTRCKKIFPQTHMRKFSGMPLPHARYSEGMLRSNEAVKQVCFGSCTTAE